MTMVGVRGEEAQAMLWRSHIDVIMSMNVSMIDRYVEILYVVLPNLLHLLLDMVGLRAGVDLWHLHCSSKD